MFRIEHGHEPARAELRLWKASTAILGAIVVLCGLGAVLFGSWIGSGGLTGGGGTPTPIPFNAGILATPLINVEAQSCANDGATPKLTAAQFSTKGLVIGGEYAGETIVL